MRPCSAHTSGLDGAAFWWCTYRYITSQHCTTDVIFVEKATPSVGDLCLEQNKTLQGDVPLLLVYYTDSLDQPPKWGTICDDQVDGTALTTMCQQLGYDDAKPT